MTCGLSFRILLNRTDAGAVQSRMLWIACKRVYALVSLFSVRRGGTSAFLISNMHPINVIEQLIEGAQPDIRQVLRIVDLAVVERYDDL